MFPLHYKTRRFFCRVAFVLLCLLPTAGVLLWAGWLATPAHVEACRREIEEQFQVAAKLATVSHPHPRVAIYEGLELLDPNSHQRLAYFPRLEAATRNRQLVLIATGPELEEGGLARLPAIVERALRTKASSITLVAGALSVRQGDREEQLKDVRVRLTGATAGDEITCSFRPAAGSSQAAELRIVRQASPTMNTIELDTGGGELPCVVAVPFVARLAHLGEQATFQGTLKLQLDQYGWHGVVQGKVARIDLARAIAANFGQRIDGLAELQLARARLSQSSLVEAVGSVSAGPGLIGPSLRIAAAEALDLPASQVALQPDGLLEYEQLAFDFTLNADGVSLLGRCAQGAPGALLIDRRQLLLAQPRRQPQPVSALIRALAPPGAGWVPATREAAWLLAVLPQNAASRPK
jgi:hypothetical protein